MKYSIINYRLRIKVHSYFWELLNYPPEVSPISTASTLLKSIAEVREHLGKYWVLSIFPHLIDEKNSYWCFNLYSVDLWTKLGSFHLLVIFKIKKKTCLLVSFKHFSSFSFYSHPFSLFLILFIFLQ